MIARCFAFLFAASFLASPGLAETAEKTESVNDRPVLALVVVDNLQRSGGAITAFDRLDMAFAHVANERKWPVTLSAERFAANTPDHDNELRVFLQPVRAEKPGELVSRSWVTLTISGKKHDFGVVLFRFYPRAGEHADDTLEKLYRGTAAAIADKVEPVLFPKPPGTK
ncbi:MAG TPA: hypothetical protein VHN79_04850 [Lacunisphaera sp.]|nr:hypothetical protein [Lacunisphaera sp.]